MAPNVLQYSEYLKEYYQPAPSTGEDMVRLYRGDSSYVHQYDVDKFETNSMFGPGQYLTDNRHIAFTYTTKGDKSKVVFDFIISGDHGTKKKYAVINFVTNWLMFKLAGIKPPNEDFNWRTDSTSKYNSEGDDYYDLKTSKFNSWGRYGDCRDEEDYKQYKNYYDKKRQEDEAMEAKYGKMYDAAMDYLKKNPRKYKFIITKGGDECSWEVVDTTIKQGHISEFDVPKHMIENCYDATGSIPTELYAIVKKCWTLDVKEKTAAKLANQDSKVYISVPKSYAEKMKYNGERIKTFSNMVSVMYEMREWSKKVWNIFIKQMKGLGYEGIVYLGGSFTDSPTKHHAYVIWDTSKITRVR